MSVNTEGKALIDTSAWIDALRRDGDPTVRAEVRLLIAQGLAVFSKMVLLELWNGARGEAETVFLEQLQRDLDWVDTTGEVWNAAMAMARACRDKGVTVPSTDLLIAACAQVHGLALLHHDSHFDLIAQTLGRGRAS